MKTKLTLKIDANKVQPLVNLFSEVIQEHIEMAQLLHCLDKEKVQGWVDKFATALVIKE